MAILFLLFLLSIFLVSYENYELFDDFKSEYPCRVFLSDKEFLNHMITHHQIAIDISIQHIQNTKNDTVGYAIHLGVTPNQFYNEFPIDLTVNGNDQSIDMQVNMEQWFNGINKINLNDGFGYMMEDQQKQLLFKQNGVGVFALK